MAEVESPKALSDRIRIRDLSKYYCATSPRLGAKQQEHISDRSSLEEGAFQVLPPRLASDSGLTALAQLAAFRLRCQRSFISIIDDKTQHIIAEATRSSSCFDENDHNPGDGILLGAQPLPIGFGVCPLTMSIFSGDSKVAFSGAHSVATKNYIVVEDLLSEEIFKECGALAGLPPILRYYVEVPLWTESGCLLGSICVVDPEVRHPQGKDIARLQEVAKLVVQKLEWTRMKEDHRRAERLLEGLAHFVQGGDSISEWSKATIGQEDIPSAYPERSRLSVDTVASVAGSAPHTVDSGTGSTGSRTTTTLPNDSSETSATTMTPGTTPYTTSTPGERSNSTATDVETGFDPLPPQASTDDVQNLTLASMSTRRAFSRASNLIRESMDLDATCFLEVPQNQRFKYLKKKKSTVQLDQTAPSTSESENPTDSSSTDITPKDDAEREAEDTKPSGDVLCHRLGFATRTGSSLAGSTTTQPYLTIPALLLGRLTAKYPSGHIFHFDSSGAISSSDDRQMQQTPARHNRNPQRLSSRLFKHFPSARSLIFYPLYDNDKQQVYAGFLGWTNDPTRSLQANEIVYVSGFANSIMCEVMRLETLATDTAKSNFISSISHELRSPLHGILAAVQLLSESEIIPKQAEFLHMIDVCARTLLDIMNHLLDHAKINHFTGKQRQKKTGNRFKGSNSTSNLAKSKPKTYSLVTDVNLLALIEETVASISASSNQILWQAGGKAVRDVTPLGDPSAAKGANEKLSIPVVLNLPYRKEWTFCSEAGSWRRIIMNLLGNAVKYTQSGFISINLTFPSSQSRSSSRNLSGRNNSVELRISDTGQGISQEYLKHRLYTPFSQENNLSVGAGLGLSLVHQIVTSLHGEIEIQSEVGTGTDIIVRIPLETPEQVLPDWPPVSINESDLGSMKGATVKLAGFDAQPPIYEAPTGIPSPEIRALLAMKESLSDMLEAWFGMSLTASDGVICVVEEKYLETALEFYDQSDRNLLVIGLEGRGTLAERILKANFIYLQPPIGPIRMAQALKSLFINRESMPHTSANAHLRPLPTRPLTVDEPNLARRQTPPKTYPPAPTLATIPEILKSGEDIEAAQVIDSSADDDLDNLDPKSLLVDLLPHPRRPKPIKQALLLVDDNDINLRILIACITRLKLNHLECITATNGKEALDKYIEATDAGTRITVVFMDVSMPVMDGFASARKIRAFEKKNGLTGKAGSRIIALTGLGSAEHQHEIESCGFDLYLRKPVNLEMVRKIVVDDVE